MSSFKFLFFGWLLLRKKSEKCIAFLVPSLHCKLALFGVPLSLQPLPSLRWLVLNIYSPMNVKFARALSFGKYGLL